MVGADKEHGRFLKWGLTLIEVRIKYCQFYIVDQIGQIKSRGSDCEVGFLLKGHAQDDRIHARLPALKHENIGKPLGLPFPLLHERIIPVKGRDLPSEPDSSVQCYPLGDIRHHHPCHP